jgi:hypothetical protein
MPINFNKETGKSMTPDNRSQGGQGLSVQGSIQMAVKAMLERMMNPFKITLPVNFYNPVGADSFDIRALDVFTAGQKKVLMTYTAKAGQTIHFIKYGLFTDILSADNVRFYPTIDGNRILRYHGDPNNDFALNLSVGPDLTEDSMIPCEFDLKAGQTLQIVGENLSGADADLGVRFRGYIVNENASSRGFGG